MIYMMKEVEKKEVSILNIFPLRNNVVPHHIRIDTSTLVHMLLRKEHKKGGDYYQKTETVKTKEMKFGGYFLIQL